MSKLFLTAEQWDVAVPLLTAIRKLWPMRHTEDGYCLLRIALHQLHLLA